MQTNTLIQEIDLKFRAANIFFKINRTQNKIHCFIQRSMLTLTRVKNKYTALLHSEIATFKDLWDVERCKWLSLLMAI